jgi:hypothetical protein
MRKCSPGLTGLICLATLSALCALLAACGENTALRDYVNNHVIPAAFDRVEIADAAGWELFGEILPTGTVGSAEGGVILAPVNERVAGEPGHTVIKIILHNSRKSAYTPVFLGNDADLVEDFRWYGTQIIYCKLKPDAIERERALDITLRLAAMPGYKSPDDISLPLVCARLSLPGKAQVVLFPLDGASVERGGTLRLWAAVTGPFAGSQQVTWSVADSAGNPVASAVDSDGLLTAAPEETAETLIVKAVSTANPSLSGTAQVAVVDRAVTFGRVEALGNTENTTVRLVLYFNRDIPNLAADNITFTPANAITASEDLLKVNGAVGVYELPVQTQQSQTVTVGITAAGYEIRPDTREVTVPQPSFPVALTDVTAVATDGTTSKLTLFFDQDIPGGLAAGDIQITPADMVTIGAVNKLPNTTGVYEAQVTGVAKGGEVLVAAVKAGVNNNALTVTVARTALFTGMTAESSNGSTTKLILQFNADIAGLSLADITLDGGAATKGSTLTAKGSGKYELEIDATKFGTATVKINKTGITFSPSSQSVAVIGVADSSNASIKAKFGVSTTGATGVQDTFNALHQYIQAGGLAPSSTVIRLGDWIDLEGGLAVEAYNGGGGDFRYSGSSDYTRLIVVGINSFHSGRGTFPGGDGRTANGTTKNGQTGGQYTVTANDGTPHVVFQFQNIPVMRRMNPGDTNTGGYRDSEMRQYLIQKFLPGLKNAGVPEDALWEPKRSVSAKRSVSEIKDALWLPTEREMYQNGKDTGYNDGPYSEAAYETAANQARLEYYTDDASRKKLLNTEGTKWYWGASPYAAGSTWSDDSSFCCVYSNGIAHYDGASAVGGCAPAFCVR